MSAPLIAVIDYGMGNRRSVEKALQRIGADPCVTADPTLLRSAAALVLPGVGAFPQGMQNLRARGLDHVVRERAAAGTPILGICLGMQLLFERSSEIEPAEGLGLIAGEVTLLRTGGLPVPHIGWNSVLIERPSSVLTAPAAFYHVHSYAARPADAADVVATAEYGESFATAVAKENVFGVQFHPEKSSRDGLALLSAFADLGRGRLDRHAAAA